LLRKQASLDKKAVLIGQANRFELWDEQTWEERNASFELSDEVMSKLSSLKL
jgi:MraZ protein